jgi:uracil-DNA glycosylase
VTRNCEATALLKQEIDACRFCAAQLPHKPRPVAQFSEESRILIIGQAPGARVHASGVPWDDASGARLREWTGISEAIFYDPSKIAFVPMGFCYPGTGKGGDLPPRPECAPLWHDRILGLLPPDRLTLLVGSYAQSRYLALFPNRSMTNNVREQPGASKRHFALPHPSWRSAMWMQRNRWFEREILPMIRSQVRERLQSTK